MNKSTSKNQLSQLVADLEEDAVLKLVQQRLDAGEDPLQIINECNEGCGKLESGMKEVIILSPG
jgi:methanogenic corrinoid protein MtbC1